MAGRTCGLTSAAPFARCDLLPCIMGAEVQPHRSARGGGPTLKLKDQAWELTFAPEPRPAPLKPRVAAQEKGTSALVTSSECETAESWIHQGFEAREMLAMRAHRFDG